MYLIHTVAAPALTLTRDHIYNTKFAVKKIRSKLMEFPLREPYSAAFAKL